MAVPGGIATEMKTQSKTARRALPYITCAFLFVLSAGCSYNSERAGQTVFGSTAGSTAVSTAVSQVGSKAGKGATVYIIRGGGGYFPNLGKIVNDHYETRGLNVIDYRVHRVGLAASDITAAYREGRLPHGVHLVGYSLGGPAAVRLALKLQEEKIPVRLLVFIETVSPSLLVPANVKGCFNLYHAPAATVGPVRAASAKTKVVNCEAYTDAGFGSEYGHFRIPWVDGVHQLIADKIVDAVHGRPLTQAKPSRYGR